MEIGCIKWRHLLRVSGSARTCLRPICAAWLSSVENLEGKRVRRRVPFLIASKRNEILERLLFL